MPPKLARYLIQRYSRTGDTVLDPFCGKGTVLLEACLLGRTGIGVDVAPDAVIVTNAKVNPPTTQGVLSFLADLNCKNGPTRNNNPWQIRTFFSKKTLSQILAIRAHLSRDIADGSQKRKCEANFVLGTLLGILHGHSRISLSLPCSHSFAMAPNYVRKYARKFGLRRPSRKVKECLISRSKQLLADKPGRVRGRAFVANAAGLSRHLPKKYRPVDLIITSPPYLNVQTYGKDSWLRLWLLGIDYKKIRPGFIETGSPKLYLEKMKPCLVEMLRTLKPGGYAIVIGGDAPINANGSRRFFRTADELGFLATTISFSGYGFKREATVLDGIPAHARYYSAVHKDGKKSNSDSGRKGVRLERIVILRKVKRSHLKGRFCHAA
jgi:hypothetical protein